MRRSLSGPFHCDRPQDHHWRLVRAAPPRAEIHAIGSLPPPEVPDVHSTVVIDWCGAEVSLAVESPRDTRRIAVRSAFIHESMPHLYDALPLARFDSRARRFWRWVFLVVRLPGGGLLLARIARRA